MLATKTHREVKQPRVSARYLADYMAASETARRTILRNCKYPSTARVVQHDLAKTAVSAFICSGGGAVIALSERANQLRDMLEEDDFKRSVLDHNADYIENFSEVAHKLSLPAVERLPPGNTPTVKISDVTVTAELHFRLRRTTKSNKVKIGGGMLRYAKNRPLNEEVAAWQSAFLMAYLNMTGADPSAASEAKLCLTVDAWTGNTYAAPGDSISRFKNMEAACASIAERWENIKPPPKAIF